MSDNGTEQIVELSGGKFRVMGRGKKPFMRSGAGLLGMMVCTLDEKKVLCHECGQLFQYLGGEHLGRHGLNATAYRIKHSLYTKQRLSSPAFSDLRKKQFLSLRRQGKLRTSSNFSPFIKGHKLSPGKGNGSHRSMAYRNRMDTCEAQLYRRLRAVAKEWRKKPEDVTYGMDERLAKSVACHFGSWIEGKVRLMQLDPKTVLGKPRRRSTEEDRIIV